MNAEQIHIWSIEQELAGLPASAMRELRELVSGQIRRYEWRRGYSALEQLGAQQQMSQYNRWPSDMGRIVMAPPPQTVGWFNWLGPH